MSQKLDIFGRPWHPQPAPTFPSGLGIFADEQKERMNTAKTEETQAVNTETDDQIDERFNLGLRTSHLGNSWEWTLCQYEWYGATNYIALQKDPKRYKGYRLAVETESGYSTPFIMGFYDADDVLRVIEGFRPTNKGFKTDRK